jgi:hypothetical protein
MMFVGVKCKTPNCDSTIALQEVWIAPNQAKWINPQVSEFTAECRQCHQPHQYARDDVGLFES